VRARAAARSRLCAGGGTASADCDEAALPGCSARRQLTPEGRRCGAVTLAAEVNSGGGRGGGATRVLAPDSRAGRAGARRERTPRSTVLNPPPGPQSRASPRLAPRPGLSLPAISRRSPARLRGLGLPGRSPQQVQRGSVGAVQPLPAALTSHRVPLPRAVPPPSRKGWQEGGDRSQASGRQCRQVEVAKSIHWLCVGDPGGRRDMC
jgi:hypothetical protein